MSRLTGTSIQRYFVVSLAMARIVPRKTLLQDLAVLLLTSTTIVLADPGLDSNLLCRLPLDEFILSTYFILSFHKILL